MVSLTPNVDAVREIISRFESETPENMTVEQDRIHTLSMDLFRIMALYAATGDDEGRNPNQTLHELANGLANTVLSIAHSQDYGEMPREMGTVSYSMTFVDVLQHLLKKGLQGDVNRELYRTQQRVEDTGPTGHA